MINQEFMSHGTKYQVLPDFGGSVVGGWGTQSYDVLRMGPQFLLCPPYYDMIFEVRSSTTFAVSENL